MHGYRAQPAVRSTQRTAPVAAASGHRKGLSKRNQQPLKPVEHDHSAYFQTSAAFVDAPSVSHSISSTLFIPQQLAGPRQSAASISCSREPLISWAGAGIFFFWQLGAYKFLREKYDLSKVPMVGASGGALAAVLAACNVDPDVVLQSAYELSCQQNIWERPLGLLGVWGALIEEWLDTLLPANAVEICNGQTTLVVTEVLGLQQVGISEFKDRQDLINVAMASAHVPFLLDWNLGRVVRGQLYFDGSLPDFITADNCELLKAGGHSVMFDYTMDSNLLRTGRMDMLELKEYDDIKRMMAIGYKFARSKHEQGEFARFDMPKIVRASTVAH